MRKKGLCSSVFSFSKPNVKYTAIDKFERKRQKVNSKRHFFWLETGHMFQSKQLYISINNSWRAESRKIVCLCQEEI